jgi:hypothetical protein
VEEETTWSSRSFRDGAQAESDLGQILPLFGTWVGAVIAFWFAKDNLETAARTTKDPKDPKDLESLEAADVFVTASGESTEPVAGWITNVEIGKLSQA